MGHRCLLVGVWLASGVAHADDTLAAQALFDEGLRLMDEGHYAEACPRFAESQRLAAGGGTMTNLALCHEREGKLATAMTEYDAALAQAIADRRSEREAFIREHMRDLGPRVPIITVQLPPSPPANFHATLDRTILTEAMHALKLPIDPGSHTIVATAPGYVAWTKEITVTPGSITAVQIPRLDPSAAPRATLEPNYAFPALLAAGGALVLGGALAAIPAFSARATFHEDCVLERNYCRSSEGTDAAVRMRDWTWVSSIALVSGAALLVTALVIPRYHKVFAQTSSGLTLSW